MMDKLEALRRLDQLYLELIREEDALRELCKEWDGNISFFF